MGKSWKKLWLTRKVNDAKKAVQEVAEIIEEAVQETKKAKTKSIWKRKKGK